MMFIISYSVQPRKPIDTIFNIPKDYLGLPTNITQIKTLNDDYMIKLYERIPKL